MMRKLKLFVLVLSFSLISGCSGSQIKEVTLENYDKITEGMSFNEVKKILGKPTIVFQEIEVKGIKAGTYAWEFKEDELVGVLAIENGRVKIKMPPQEKGSCNLRR